MASKREVLFNFRFESNGKQMAGALGIDLKQIQSVVDMCTGSTTKFKKELNQLAKSQFAFNQITTGLQSVQGMFQSLSDAYAVQIQAEQQLQQVMAQRMDATEADVQAIKDLCSAQQALGVVGDEVQLAGVKQLAMFASNQETLRTLIPAMNDLAVMQRGYNVTAMDTERVAQAIGRALQGQDRGLRQFGISLNASQKEIMKYGDEQARAALLADLFANSVGGVNEKMAATSAGAMKQFSNTMGDMMEKLGGMVQKIMPTITSLAMLSMALANVGKLVSAVKMLGVSIVSLSKATVAGAVSLYKWAACVNVTSKAAEGARVAAIGLKIAWRGLIIATGIGAVIWALTAAIEAFAGSSDQAADSSNKLADGLDSAAKAGAKAKAELQMQAAKLKALMDAHKDTAKAVNDLNTSYGTVFGTFATAAQWYDVLIKKSDLYVKAKVAETRANQQVEKAADYADQIAKQEELMRNLESIGVTEDSLTDRYGHRFTNPIWDKENKKLQILKHNYRVCTQKAQALTGQAALLNDQLKVPSTAVTTTTATTATTTPKPSAAASADKVTEGPTAEETHLRFQLSLLHSLDDLDTEIRYQEQQRSAAYTSFEIANIDKRIEALRREKDALEGIHPEPAYQPQGVDKLNTLKQLEDEERYYQDLQNDCTAEEYDNYQRIIEQIQHKRDAFNQGSEIRAQISDIADIAALKDIDGKEYTIKVKAIGIEGLTDKIKEADRWLKATGDKGLTEGQRREVEDYRSALIDMRREAFDAMGAIQEGWSSLKSVDSAISSMTQALEGNGTAWEKVKSVIDGALSLYNTVASVIAIVQGVMEIFGEGQQKQGAASQETGAAQAIGAAVGTAATATQVAISVPLLEQLTSAYMKTAAAAYMAAHAYIPFAGFGIGTGFTTAAEGVVQAVGAMKFAKGGIAYGPTVGLVGEYPGARNNPEVIAPLDKLRTLMKPEQGMGGKVEFEIRDRVLYGILRRYNAITSRT